MHPNAPQCYRFAKMQNEPTGAFGRAIYAGTGSDAKWKNEASGTFRRAFAT